MKKSIALIMAVLVLMTTLLSNAVFAANEPAFVASNVTGAPGDTVQVTVSVANNPGIVSAKVKVGYDESVLKLESAAAGESDYTTAYFGPTTKNPFSVTWEDFLATEDITTNGVVATLTFTILDTAAAGKSDITLAYNPDDVCDVNMDNVTFATVAGSVTVVKNDVDYSTAISNKGANIRLEAENITPGLRFASTLSKADLGIEGDYIYDANADVTFGMLLLPKEILEDTAYSTVDKLFMSGESNDIAKVVGKKVYEQNDTTLTYTAVLIDIPEESWAMTICAVPYVFKDGEYYFGAQMENSYYKVAKAARSSQYSDSAIAKITDATEKAKMKAIADKLQAIIDEVDDKQGWIDGWY